MENKEQNQTQCTNGCCHHMHCGKKSWIYKIFKIAVLVMVICFIGRMAVGFGNWRDKSDQINTISFTGHGEVSAVPDIASVSFTIRKEAKTVKEAQEAVAVVEKKVLESLKTNEILDKDIKTVSASFNPKYEYGTCYSGYCPPQKQTIVGYEAYENINLKIRNADSVGKVIQDIGALGVSDLNGPNFTVDKEDALKAEARKEAIADAKAKAKILAKDLDVKLVKIVAFDEGGNYPVPMYDNAMAKGVSMMATAPAPAELPKGENLITSDVTITYEIR